MDKRASSPSSVDDFTGGIPVATVAIDGAQNAGLLAVQMLAIEDSELAKKLDTQRNKSAEKVLEKNKAVEAKYNK